MAQTENKRGKFITFEGCDGCGKSTQIKLLGEYFKAHGIDYIITREPGGGSVSEKIRSIILDGKNSSMTDECEALLFSAARVQHLADTVEPALKEGKIVLCDRYVDSSFAYQGEARGLGFEFVENVNSYAVKNYMPDITVFIDFTPENAFKRKHGADENDRMEQAGIEFHKKVYEGFKKCLKTYSPERVVYVDGNASIEEISKKVLEGVLSKM